MYGEDVAAEVKELRQYKGRGIALIAICSMILLMLTACKGKEENEYEPKKTAKTPEQVAEDLLKKADLSDDTDLDGDENPLIEVVTSRCGYDSDGRKAAILVIKNEAALSSAEAVEYSIFEKGEDTPIYSDVANIEFSDSDSVYALLDFSKASVSGEIEIAVTDVEERAETQIVDNLYASLCESEMARIDNRLNAIDNETIESRVDTLIQLLLITEYCSEGDVSKESARIAAKIANSLLNESENRSEGYSTTEKYNVSAALAMAAIDCGSAKSIKDYREEAERLYEEADSVDTRAYRQHYCAAAQLYRLTKDTKYKTEFETMANDEIAVGFSYESPGYLGSMAYTLSDKADSKTAADVMASFFNDANAIIKTNIWEQQSDEVVSDMRLLPVADYVSESTEYTKYMESFISWYSGVNLQGCDYSEGDYSEILFILARLAEGRKS